MRLQELRGKDCIGGLKTNRLRISQVVPDHIDLSFGCGHAGEGGGKGGCEAHGMVLGEAWVLVLESEWMSK